MATVKKKAATPAKEKSPEVSLADICKKLNLKPATARVKLRGSKFAESAGSRWVWPAGSKALSDVEAFLKA